MSVNAVDWNSAETVTLSLQGTPVGLQPSEYIQTTVQQDEVGAVQQIQVQALHNGDALFFRLSWSDPHQDVSVEDPSEFPDGAAIMFPFKDDAPLMLMGSEDRPVNQWHWKADEAQPHNVTTAGLGTTYRTPASFVEAFSQWQNGAWTVVLSRLLKTSDPDNHVPFEPGQTFKAAFCVWEGSKKERAGLKAFSPNWTEFHLEA